MEVYQFVLDNISKLMQMLFRKAGGQIGDGTNYTEFESTGFAKAVGDACAYDDIVIRAINLRAGATPPAYNTFQDSIQGVAFENLASDIVYGSFEIPHTYNEGSDLEVHLHWSPSSTNTGRCDWVMKYTYANMNGVFGAEETLTFQQEGSGVVNKNQYVSANVFIDGTAKALKIGAVFLFALSRPTGDAFTGDAFLHEVGVHYQRDTLGSRQMAIK